MTNNDGFAKILNILTFFKTEILLQHVFHDVVFVAIKNF